MFDPFVDQGEKTHLAEHVQGIVAGGAVCSYAEVDLFVQHPGHGSESVAQFGVTGRVCHDRGTALMNEVQISALHLHAVGQNCPVIEEAQIGQQSDRGHSVLLQAVPELSLTLGQMDLLEHVEFSALFRDLLQKSGGAGVDRVGGEDEF